MSVGVRAHLPLAMLLAVSCSVGETGRPGPDILLVTVDTLRPDHLGLYGYPRDTTPNIDRWFAEGIRFERSYATEANTSPSVISILSGRYPQEHRVRLLHQLVPDACTLLTDVLPSAYQTAAFVSNIVLTDEAMGIADRFDHYDDFVDEREPHRNVYERNAERTTDAALLWLLERRDPERPLFLWVHYMDPHGPYRPPPGWALSFAHEGSVRLDPSRIHAYQREPGVTDALTYVDRYDEEIAYLDRHIGRLLDGQRRIGGADRAAFVLFTADHGESMLEHERWFTHGYHVYEEIVRVPLLIQGPGVVADTRPEPVSGVDVFPTLLRVAGVPPPEDLPGVDLLDTSAADPERTLYTEGSSSLRQVRAVIRGNRKWLAFVERGTGRIEGGGYYDLEADPEERRRGDLARYDAAPLRALRDRIRSDPDPGGQPLALERGMRLEAPKVAPRADAETLERLRALGYVD